MTREPATPTTAATMPTPARCLPSWLVLLLFAALLGVFGYLTFLPWQVMHQAQTLAQDVWTSRHADDLRTLPHIADPDAAYYVKMARQLEDPRVRGITFDGAPGLRPVYWAQAQIWYLRALGQARATFTGEPLDRAILHAAVWANPLLLLLALTAAFALLWWRGHPLAGLLLAAGLVLAPAPLQMFRAGAPDHHGWHILALVGLVLGLVLELRTHVPLRRGGLGWAGHVSALCAGVFLWVGASQALVVFALLCTGLALGLALLRWRRAPELANLPPPETFRCWGLAIAAWSLFFYLLEFTPNHFAMRLEVNHPLYLPALIASGELLCRGARLLRPPPTPARRSEALAATACVLVIGAVGLCLYLAPQQWFYLNEPLSQRVMLITEELRPPVAFRAFPAITEVPWDYQILLALLILLPLGTWLNRRHLSATHWLALAGTFTVLAGIALLACLQMRWTGQAIAAAASAGATLLLVLPPGPTTRRRWFIILLSAYILLISLNLLPGLVGRQIQGQVGRQAIDITAREQMARYFQAEAAAPGAPRPYLLSTPLADATTTLFQHAPVKLMRSMYWENLEGNRLAYTLLSHPVNDALRDEIRRLGLTHIAVTPRQNDVTTVFYAATGNPLPQRESLIITLAHPTQPNPPPWLKPVDQLDTPELRTLEIRLYQVVDDQ